MDTYYMSWPNSNNLTQVNRKISLFCQKILELDIQNLSLFFNTLNCPYGLDHLLTALTQKIFQTATIKLSGHEFSFRENRVPANDYIHYYDELFRTIKCQKLIIKYGTYSCNYQIQEKRANEISEVLIDNIYPIYIRLDARSPHCCLVPWAKLRTIINRNKSLLNSVGQIEWCPEIHSKLPDLYRTQIKTIMLIYPETILYILPIEVLFLIFTKLISY